MENKHTKIIVTGGAGFIGSHLTDALVAQGFEVHVIDNLSTGKKEDINPGAVWHDVDIRDLEQIRPLFNNTDCVFHLAARARVQPSMVDPKTTHDINVSGTLNVLIASKDAQVKRFVYSASSSAYGDQQVFPLREDFPASPLSPYGLQKYIGELYCRLFHKLYGLETVSLRYFSVYGPRAPLEGAYALVIGRFLKQRREDQALTVVPDGNQSRDFTHVADVARANILAMESARVGQGEVINIGGGHDHTVAEVARLIGGPTVFIEPRLEPRRTLADIAKAKESLGWEPLVKFTEGIEELKKIYLS